MSNSEENQVRGAVQGEVATTSKEDQEQEGQCTCGHYLGQQEDTISTTNKSTTTSTTSSTTNAAVDASFVHLPTLLFRTQHYDPRNNINNNNSSRTTSGNGGNKSSNNNSNNDNFLATYQHLQLLLQAAETGGKGDIQLCSDCLSRVEYALDTESERLENETLLYQQFSQKEKERSEQIQRSLQKVVATKTSSSSSSLETSVILDSNDMENNITPEELQNRAEQAFLDEIEALEEECRRQEAELEHLKALKKEQFDIQQDLIDDEYALEEERNALELEARAFDNDQEQLYRELKDIQTEVDKLSSLDIHLPSMLLDLQVDKERGLRYPLINELRLAYRPKGDVKWDEIQAAWSLAAQLLLVVGTLFHYPSKQWKIVPLDCAKLIYFNDEDDNNSGNTKSKEITSLPSSSPPPPSQQKQQQQKDMESEQRRKKAIVYHLGHPKTNGSKALRAWNTLLHQVAIHVNNMQEEALRTGEMTIPFPKMPYPMTTTAVGTIDLLQLNDNDDAGWSRAIHFMASNLQWLSECASLYTSQQVVWTAAAIQACKN